MKTFQGLKMRTMLENFLTQCKYGLNYLVFAAVWIASKLLCDWSCFFFLCVCLFVCLFLSTSWVECKVFLLWGDSYAKLENIITNETNKVIREVSNSNRSFTKWNKVPSVKGYDMGATGCQWLTEIAHTVELFFTWLQIQNFYILLSINW